MGRREKGWRGVKYIIVLDPETNTEKLRYTLSENGELEGKKKRVLHRPIIRKTRKKSAPRRAAIRTQGYQAEVNTRERDVLGAIPQDRGYQQLEHLMVDTFNTDILDMQFGVSKLWEEEDAFFSDSNL